jgi:Ca-activated chloride channel family protein
MTPGISLQRTLSRSILAESSEQQLLYLLLEATPEGTIAQLPKLPLNLCLVIDRSSSMRGDRLNQVKEAAGRILDQLGQNDFFSLVTFNDRAEVVVSATRVQNRNELKQAISRVEAAGGTEMARGMALALQEIQRPMLVRGLSRIMLLTDGRTYGDESTCVEIARRAQSRNIGLTALGIGTEWNEDLLETMTASENSHAQYIAAAHDVAAVFAEEMRRMHSVFAQRVRLSVSVRPGGMLRSLEQVRPFLASVPISEAADREWVASLSDWTGGDVQGFLLEIVTPVLPVGEHPLMKVTLRYDLPGAALTDQNREEIVRISVQPAAQVSHQVDSTVKYWLERLMAYRLQARAWKDVSEGKIDEASQKLQMAGTRLFGAGEQQLARTVQEEGTRLLRNGNTSEEGRKRIKFGTRGLMGAGPTDERVAGE